MDITSVIGRIPYRMALAGGCIDQPFVSRLNPSPPGSMVVVSMEPVFLLMDRCGMATSSRKVAMELWNGVLPDRDPAVLVRELYNRENENRPEPSGSQDMAGLVYPGVNRLDFDFQYEGGYFPVHVESNTDPEVAGWLENNLHILPVAQRTDGYNPLMIKHLDVEWIRRLGQTGKDCFDAIVARDARRLGASMNECMRCWENILPLTIVHANVNLVSILEYYQSRYAGAMYSGCGGGYLYVVSEETVPGAIRVKIRIK